MPSRTRRRHRTADAAILVRPWPHAASVASLELRRGPSDLSNLMSQMQLTLPRPATPAATCGRCWVCGRGRPASSCACRPASPTAPTCRDLAGRRRVEGRLPATLLEFPVLELHTEVCQAGACSDRGYCDNSTRQCVCASFWMENPLLVFDSATRESPNCDLSPRFGVRVSGRLTESAPALALLRLPPRRLAGVLLLAYAIGRREFSLPAAACCLSHLRTGSGSKVRRLEESCGAMR
uniref:EB domain-containing protein n=1 Tax=Macrostomum lignano TaxID=282301 RepID=A0A1I8JS58_9PLAT